MYKHGFFSGNPKTEWLADTDGPDREMKLLEDFKYTDFDELLYSLDGKKTSFICLDSISDPHNLGSIIRTAACFGDFALVIPRRSSCEVNDTVMHVASGGEGGCEHT